MGPDEVTRLTELFPGVSFVRVPPEGDVPADIHGEILLLAGSGPNLPVALGRGVKWIHTVATGIDHFPFDVLSDSVVFTNSRGAGGIAISEWTLAMMLAFAKQLPDSWITDNTATWTKGNLRVLYGQTLALVGIGGIGTEIARRALAFGMHVIALRRRQAPSPIAGVELVPTLADLLPRADHLVLATPLTPTTRHLLDSKAFTLVKPGVHLVNISRGDLIDQEALRVALDTGQVARASLDVQTPEPLPSGHWLYSHPAVKISPHISWSAPWGMDRTYEKFGENLARYLEGQPLVGVVDLSEQY
jgi:phosphoglycerate dehydrogenase-like enzyme